jgi:RNA polymerase sigma-70 factor (ECF subfamily)
MAVAAPGRLSDHGAIFFCWRPDPRVPFIRTRSSRHCRLEAPLETTTPATGLDFAQLFRSYAPLVLRALRRLGVAERDLEDVAQDVFVTLHAKLGEIERPEAIRSYVYGIAVRHAADHRKRAHVRREHPGGDTLPEGRGSAPQLSEILATERRARLDRALATLENDKRVVLVLYEIEELPMREVAEAVGVPLQTAYSRLYAARKELAAALHELGPMEGVAR